jgi:hypothetical protein
MSALMLPALPEFPTPASKAAAQLEKSALHHEPKFLEASHGAEPATSPKSAQSDHVPNPSHKSANHHAARECNTPHHAAMHSGANKPDPSKNRRPTGKIRQHPKILASPKKFARLNFSRCSRGTRKGAIGAAIERSIFGPGRPRAAILGGSREIALVNARALARGCRPVRAALPE